MKDDGGSRTAASVAFRRAAHQLIDRPPVFVDPIAIKLVSPEGQAVLARNPWHRNGGAFAAALRAFLAVRSRIAEDQLALAVAAGVKQYVVLGAGFDTFAYRNPYPALRVFEVDHPRTQAGKRTRLEDAGLAVPASVTYVGVDFEKDTLADRLKEAGFTPSESTAISWLGVVPYLEAPAIWATLEWAASVVGPHGHIVFDYGSKPKWWQLARRLALRRLSRRVAAAGEPFRTILDPEFLRERLASIGFTSIVDMDKDALNSNYFSARADGLRVGGGGHVVIASRP